MVTKKKNKAILPEQTENKQKVVERWLFTANNEIPAIVVVAETLNQATAIYKKMVEDKKLKND